MMLPVALLQLNEGQLDWMPKNPRQWTQDGVNKAKDSLERDPDFLDDRPLLVVPHDGAFVVYAGNMRLTAARELGVEALPCVSYEPESVEDRDTIKRRAILDNGDFGAWDWDALANEWDDLPLGDWGVPAWKGAEDDGESVGDGEGTQSAETREEVEEMINDAIRKAASELYEQVVKLGGITFFTPNAAKVDFIKFAYYNGEYRRSHSLAFHPQQIRTAGDTWGSLLDGLIKVSEGQTKAERLRFVCGDDLRKIVSGSLPFSGMKMPLDFPASLSRALINEFTPDGGSVLDPCSGWGGRLVGFCASKAAYYEGVDASPLQIAGDSLIWETYKDVSLAPTKDVRLTVSPFEKYNAKKEAFDFALTSPPYFDTEKYEGGEQSYEGRDNYDDWRTSFYYVLIQKVYDSLKKGGVFCLQVGSQRYPLREDGIAYAKSIGFEYIETRTTEMCNNFCETAEDDGEVVVVLRKARK